MNKSWRSFTKSPSSYDVSITSLCSFAHMTLAKPTVEVAETALGKLQVKACQCFLPSLCWAVVLLGVFMTMGALIMGILAG